MGVYCDCLVLQVVIAYMLTVVVEGIHWLFLE